jgi:hypothetical protein
MADATGGTSGTTGTNIDGLPTRTVAHIVRYGKQSYTVDRREGNEVLERVRALLRDGASDIVPLTHKDGLTWLVVGPGVPITVDEIVPDKGQSDRSALKHLGLR